MGGDSKLRCLGEEGGECQRRQNKQGVKLCQGEELEKVAQAISGGHSGVTLEWQCPHLQLPGVSGSSRLPAPSPGLATWLGGFEGLGWHLQTGGRSAPCRSHSHQRSNSPIFPSSTKRMCSGYRVLK